MSINKWDIDTSWVLFLDRDGVINERVFGGYITQPADFIFTYDTASAIARLNSFFSRTIVVTNQQGIAKEIMSERNLSEIHDYMVNEIGLKGGKIDAIFYAQNLKGAENDRRKPLPAMALEAQEKFPEIDFNKAIMVGDTDSDILFGKNLGMKTIRIVTEEPIGEEADLYVEDLRTLKTLLEYEILT